MFGPTLHFITKEANVCFHWLIWCHFHKLQSQALAWGIKRYINNSYPSTSQITRMSGSLPAHTKHFLSLWDGLLQVVIYNKHLSHSAGLLFFSTEQSSMNCWKGFVRQLRSQQGSKKTVENIQADPHTPLIIKTQHSGTSSVTFPFLKESLT